MGYGDDVIATGLAKGAAARGRRIAFGSEGRIKWGPFSREIFRGNPNIAHPGEETRSDIEWIRFHPGHRIYASYNGVTNLVWNYEFKVKTGEIYFERDPGPRKDHLITIEPNVFIGDRPGKEYSSNKQWPVERYQKVADHLTRIGFKVVQPWYRKSRVRLDNIKTVDTPTYTDAVALIKKARLHIGPEGGLQQGAAAVGTRAVILFGGFSPPQVMGHDMHINLTGDDDPCGSLKACSHCAETMRRISVDEVISAVKSILGC